MHYYIFLICVMIFLADLSATITGKIVDRDTREGLSRVSIEVTDSKKIFYSNQQGFYTLENINPGTYNIKFSGTGYKTFTASDVVVGSTKPTVLEIELAPNVIENLDIVEIEATEKESSIDTRKFGAVNSTQSLDFEELMQTPGIKDDPLQAVTLFPGVNALGYSNDLLVRGGAHYENLFLIDNLEMKYLNHFGTSGNSGGAYTIINNNAVSEVIFSSGSFGSEYGNALSSITQINVKDGNDKSLSYKLEISTDQARLLLDGPINENGTFLLSASQTYFGLILDALDIPVTVNATDFTIKLKQEINDSNSISFITIAGTSEVDFKLDDIDEYDRELSDILLGKQKHINSGLDWRHLLDNGFVNTHLGANVSLFEQYQIDPVNRSERTYNYDSTEVDVRLKNDFDITTSSDNNFKFGNRLGISAADYKINLPGEYRKNGSGEEIPLIVDKSLSTPIENGTYVSYSFNRGKLLTTLGGRLDLYNYTIDTLFLSPRFSLTYSLNDNLNLLTSVGRHYQPPNYSWLVVPKQKLNPIIADQLIVGLEYTLFKDWKFKAEFFYKKYDDYISRPWRKNSVYSSQLYTNINDDIPLGLEPLSNDAKGNSYGIELFAQKKLSTVPIHALMSFSYLNSSFSSTNYTDKPGPFDAKILFNMGAGYLFKNAWFLKNWMLSTKLNYSSGVPYTPFDSGGKMDYDQYNTEKLEDHWFLNFRMEKKWNKKWFSKDYVSTFYLDVYNLTNNKFQTGVYWDRDESKMVFNKDFGIYPTIGFSIDF